jgi:tRNA(Ile)-lysidine synthase
MIRNILLNQNKKYLIAVSGGPDSMCLLNLCKKNIALVCHVNYNKRASAMRDENIVKQYCKKNRIKLKILNVTKIIYDQYKKNNFEHIAREIRYDFFYKCAKAINNFNILIAHNLDDFVETAIMQEEKKSKSLFYGIKQISFHHGLNIYHPLINYRKKELKKYCIEHDIIFGIDETNFSDLFYRNRIRKENAKLPAKKFNELISKFNKYNQNNRILYQQVNKYYLK